MPTRSPASSANKPFDRELPGPVRSARSGDGKIVELGCGPGHVAGYLASRGAKVSGLDLSAAMVEQAQRLFPEIDFQVGDMLALPFDDGVARWRRLLLLDRPFRRSANRTGIRARWRVSCSRRGLAAIAFHIGSDVLHRDEWFGEEVNVDFSFHEPAVVRGQLEAAGLEIDSLTERDPYPPPIEFQSRRCYLVARRR